MAKSDAVWGIDIGNASLKALRCRPGAAPDQVEAAAFDYIEYPKILSQPGSDPAELVGEALTQFLSRNSVRGDRVAVSVAGQNGLARFIKLPPVEAKKIPDIVRYEARQQIPFDLNDVVWDYQRIGVGAETEGFALETEIGLFAMKRDQVFRALDPFRTAGIEVDVVQLTPLALYNFIAFDQLTDVPPPDQYDPDNPPDSVVVLSMGTDATDLVITNGYRVWQRSIPLGGNHFTKALTKELKLTFAKAEHLKRNANTAEDPKAVFQAMRPVFNDLLTEIQRSIGYFTTIDRNAKIGKVLALGNGLKLPGLRRYLAQSLGYDVVRLDTFRGLSGPEVVDSAVFKENELSFGVCYGLALQGMGKASLRTNLLPREILKDRLIRSKKPWAVAAAAALLLGCTLSFAGFSRALATVQGTEWEEAEQDAKGVQDTANNFKSEVSKANAVFTSIAGIGGNLTENVEGRVVWLELLRAINACLPHDPPDKRPEDISQRNEVFITNLDCQKFADVAPWFAVMKTNKWYRPPAKAGAPAKGGENGEGEGGGDTAGPSGPGWIVRLTGYHYHNPETGDTNMGAEFVRRTLIANLENGKVEIPKGSGQMVTMKEMGISHPCLIKPEMPRPVMLRKQEALTDTSNEFVEVEGNQAAQALAGMAAPPMAPAVPGVPRVPGAPGAPGTAPVQPEFIHLRKLNFEVQFVWMKTPPSVRQQKKQEEAAKQQPDGGDSGQEESNQ